jgi:hypothetical protein
MVCALVEAAWGDIAAAPGGVPVVLGAAPLAFSGSGDTRSAGRGGSFLAVDHSPGAAAVRSWQALAGRTVREADAARSRSRAGA